MANYRRLQTVAEVRQAYADGLDVQYSAQAELGDEENGWIIPNGVHADSDDETIEEYLSGRNPFGFNGLRVEDFSE
jgi:hypothetical protein